MSRRDPAAPLPAARKAARQLLGEPPENPFTEARLAARLLRAGWRGRLAAWLLGVR